MSRDGIYAAMWEQQNAMIYEPKEENEDGEVEVKEGEAIKKAEQGGV